MKIGIKVLVLATFMLSLVVSAPAQTRRQEFNPDGAFWIVGEHPHGFSDFGGINLNGRRLRHIPSQGLQLMNGRTFHFKSLVVKRNDFRFTTIARGGVHYTFAGRFLRGGIYAELGLDDEKPVMEGVLTKYVRGKKVAEATLKFSYFGGT